MLPPDLPDLRKSLDDAIARHGLTAIGDAIHGAAVPQIWMPYDPADVGGDGGPVGAPRLGGEPDLPPDVAWPTRGGKRLPFIAQLDCSTLPRWAGSPLPASGWLYAFAGGEFPLESALIHWT